MRTCSIAGLVLLLVLGCKKEGGGTVVGPGGNGGVAILTPFQGNWKFNLSKTLAARQTAGVPASEIAQAKAMGGGVAIHPDMAIANEVAVLAGRIEEEYRFFALHPHGEWVCGKAWHHEDRHDPGDMDKYLVRLRVSDEGLLYLSVRISEDAASLSDPDLTSIPITGGNAATCTADAEKEPKWSAWRTFVFERR